MTKPHMTLPNGDVIYEGEYGLTRDGRTVGPMVYDPKWRGLGRNNERYHWQFGEGDKVRAFTDTGRFGYDTFVVHRYDIIARATPDNTDILNNTEAFGLMSEDKQRRMKKWPHGWVSWTNGGWCNSPFPTWGPVCVYRAKPAPVRITGTVQLGADGKPDFSTWEAGE